MKKINVSTGIYWVEIPEIDLRILCGCPADSVKHMMKKGLIVWEEKKGVMCETGPNAILLSDIPLQNERFSNLGEFPVLQMLYRQGLILPGHPNNTGAKPMLIGLAQEVAAQAEYIYCGNYGLTNEEDLLKAGLTREQAAELMRLKKRFAFDDIRKTEDLLDIVPVGAGVTEIRGGAAIRRTAINVFEISYGGESVSVDLNLRFNEAYEPTYHLGFHEIKREYFSIIHSGDGDGWDINRPCMSSIICFQGKIYLIDAGPNLLHSLQSLGIGVNEIEGVFHTHAHDDHFNGLTILIRADHRIKYFAAPIVRASVMRKLSLLTSSDESLFHNYFDARDLRPGEWNNIDGLEVRPAYSPHPLETTIMYFRALWGDGYKTYAHYADTTSFKTLRGMITSVPEKSGITQEYFDAVEKEYHTPVCLKKIDIGGGLIHGDAEDFVDDKSTKKILSHTALPLTDHQKEIGDNATFGAVDVLIPSNRNYLRNAAFDTFHSFFPTAPRHELEMLLNNPLSSFNPGTILLSKGSANDNVHFVLSGQLEFIVNDLGINNKLTAGSIVGELSGLLGTKARGTYRALSYVKAITVPCFLYVEFLKRNNLYDSVKKDIAMRQYLQNSWLFGERISCPLKGEIARTMTRESFEAGRDVPCGDEKLIRLVDEGELELLADGKAVETLGPGSFFGEECIMDAGAPPFTVRATRASCVYNIPWKITENIPVVRLKLLEVYEKRIRAAQAK